jgi:sugar fermentation stimulation protein A
MINFHQSIFGHLERRYQRFFMEVRLDSQEIVVAHVPNTGSMLGLLERNNRVLLTKSSDPKRRTSYTAHAIRVGEEWVGINTHLPNSLVQKSLPHPTLSFLSSYKKFKTEVTFGEGARSRVDFVFSDSLKMAAPFYLEVKNVTLREGSEAQFPDAISLRAQKHLEDLLWAKEQGFLIGLLFIVQRMDCTSFSIARLIDKKYAEKLAYARAQGLLVWAIAARVSETGICLSHELPCIF